MFRSRYFFSSLLKDSVVGTTKSVAKDVQKTAKAAKEVLEEDMKAVESVIANASDKTDRVIRGTDKERFHAAEDAAKRAQNEDEKFVLSEHSENPVNKAAKMGHEAKDSVIGSFSGKVEKAAERVLDSVKGKVNDLKGAVNNTNNNNNKKNNNNSNNNTSMINDKIKSTNPAASIDPMGETPNRDPIMKPQSPLKKETEELQKKGADRKAEEDSFNLM
jgi:hypothetical protein